MSVCKCGGNVEKYNALAKENADLKQQFIIEKQIHETSEQYWVDKHEKLRAKILDFRKAVLNPKNNSMTLFEKFDDLFEDELK